jgi:hypothetical protein
VLFAGAGVKVNAQWSDLSPHSIMEQVASLLHNSFIPANPTVVGRRDPRSLLIVHHRFLQLELPAVLLAERQACLAGERVGVEVGEHPVAGEVEVLGEGGGHGESFR